MYSILKRIFMKYPWLINLLPKKYGEFWDVVRWEEETMCWRKDQDCQS